MIDSSQTLFTELQGAAPGSVSQVREVAARLRFHELLDPAVSQMWNDVWQDVKIG